MSAGSALLIPRALPPPPRRGPREDPPLGRGLLPRPDFDEAWHEHVSILSHVGHPETAVHDLQRELEINPGNTIARFRLEPVYT